MSSIVFERTIQRIQIEKQPATYRIMTGGQGPAGANGTSGADGDITWEGPWQTATGYTANQAVENDGSSYVCTSSHTSGASTEPGVGVDWETVWELMAAKGDPGDPGAKGDPGNTGSPGADGSDPGILLNWKTGTSDADPGAGNIRADNASLASATELYVSETSRGGSDIEAFLLSLDDSTNTVKGTLTITDPASEAQATFDITGVTDATDYVKIAVSSHSGATGFADELPVSFQFSRAGDKGTDGDGAGDMLAATYDPQNIAGDAFDVDNHTDGATNKVFTATLKDKLDAIEASADVTDATNVAAAGAVMDGDFSVDGLMVRTGAGAYASRTITGTTNQIDVSDGNGDAGNPTLSLASAVTTSLSKADSALQSADIGVSVQAYDADTAKLDVENQTLTGGATVTSKSLGTQSSGTLTLDMGDRPLQHYTNNGAHTLAPGSVNGSCLVDITNDSSAGAITTSGWTKVAGDSFTITNGHKFRCHCSVGDGGSLLIVQALQ